MENYILLRYDINGGEIIRKDETGKRRYGFYTHKTAMIALKVAAGMKGIHCSKLYRRRRDGSYKWVATLFADGTQLNAWDEK